MNLIWSLSEAERGVLAEAGLLAHFLVDPQGPSERGGITDEMVTEVYDLCDNECGCCGRVNNLTLDHIIPIALGGHPCHVDNLWVLCKPCNQSKSHWGMCIIDHGGRA